MTGSRDLLQILEEPTQSGQVRQRQSQASAASLCVRTTSQCNQRLIDDKAATHRLVDTRAIRDIEPDFSRWSPVIGLEFMEGKFHTRAKWIKGWRV